MSIKAPETFNGELFMKKFGVKPEDFTMYKDELICEKLPHLTEADIADCVDLEGNSNEAILAFVEKWGSITAYSDGNENQQNIYDVCVSLEEANLLIRSKKRMTGMVIFNLNK